LDLDEESVMPGLLPLFRSFGQTCALNATIAGGGCVTLLPRFEAGRALQLIERDRVTVLEGEPSMYAALLEHPDRERVDTASLRFCASGGTALPGELLHDVEHAFGCAVVESYGVAEPLAVDRAEVKAVDEPPRVATGRLEFLRPAEAGA
jgi:long-chain acyl-CoA synthetase